MANSIFKNFDPELFFNYGHNEGRDPYSAFLQPIPAHAVGSLLAECLELTSYDNDELSLMAEFAMVLANEGAKDYDGFPAPEYPPPFDKNLHWRTLSELVLCGVDRWEEYRFEGEDQPEFKAAPEKRALPFPLSKLLAICALFEIDAALSIYHANGWCKDVVEVMNSSGNRLNVRK